MTIITITREARCKDCKFLERYKKGKLTRHKCINKNSNYFNESKTLRDFVCNNWEL